MKKKFNFVPFILLGILILNLVLHFIFKTRYNSFRTTFNYIVYFASTFVSFELLIFHLCPPFCALLLFLITRNRNYKKSKYFWGTKSEQRFYNFIKVKHWKNHALTYDDRIFRGKNFSKENLILSMTQSELVHEMIFLFSFFPITMSNSFGHFGLLLILCSIFALSNLPFIFIQRYNRPRVLKMKKSRESICASAYSTVPSSLNSKT